MASSGIADQAAVELFNDTSTLRLKSKNGGDVLVVGSVHAGFDTAEKFSDLAADFGATLIAAELCPARF